MHEVFTHFAALLDERLKRGIPTTEDSVRYTFFASLLRAGVSPHEVILELDHPTIAGARVDTWISSYQGDSVAIEFKYDRPPPGGKNPATTRKAGKVFEDLRRQVLIAHEVEARCYFVYVTTEAMAKYFRKPVNKHTNFFNLSPGKLIHITDSYFVDKPNTFMKVLGNPFDATLISVLSSSLSGRHELRVYEIVVP